MQQWPSNPQAAAAQVRAIADREQHPTAMALAAMLTVQAGASWQDGLPYVRVAAEAGIVGPLNNYFGNMLGDPAHQSEAVEFIGRLRDASWPIDPLAYIIDFAQAQPPNMEAMNRLLAIGSYPAPAGAREQWNHLVAETRAASESIVAAAQDVEAERRRTVDAITADGDRVSAERVRMEELVAEVTDLANEGAAGELARQYAKHALAEEEDADKYTRWSIWAGAFAAIATCVIAFFAFTQEHGAGAVLTKAALALPVLAFAAYISRLAVIHRKQAWRWRHTELQISTARPFVAPLEDDQRRLLTAALALRFFPGQRADGDDSGSRDMVDPVAALGELLRTSTQGADRAGASSEPTQPQTP